MAKKWSRWDENRCIEVIKVMNQFPDNLVAGFEACAEKFGGKPKLYQVAWYSDNYRLCKFRKSANSLVCTTLSTTSLNYKNSPRTNGKFRPERAERATPATVEFFKGWWSSCTQVFQ